MHVDILFAHNYFLNLMEKWAISKKYVDLRRLYEYVTVWRTTCREIDHERIIQHLGEHGYSLTVAEPSLAWPLETGGNR